MNNVVRRTREGIITGRDPKTETEAWLAEIFGCFPGSSVPVDFEIVDRGLPSPLLVGADVLFETVGGRKRATGARLRFVV